MLFPSTAKKVETILFPSTPRKVETIFCDPQVESPRSTLLRYGIPYKPYDFTKDQEHQVAIFCACLDQHQLDLRRRTLSAGFLV